MKYFGNIEWSEENKNIKGLPRPFFNIPDNLQNGPGTKSLIKNGFYLHKRVPMPWQSIPVFKESQQLKLNLENEISCVEKELCPFCGIKIKDYEICIRWTTNDAVLTKSGTRVYSDIMPFHIECMKQGRVFCPYMRTKKNKDFEVGLFKDLIINARENIKKYPPTE